MKNATKKAATTKKSAAKKAPAKKKKYRVSRSAGSLSCTVAPEAVGGVFILWRCFL